MPRNGSGVYSAPAGTTGTPNTIIDSAKYNAFVADLTNDLNAARPIVAGGTGATTKSGAQQALDLEPGVDIQAYNATLAALAALTLAADKLIYATGANTLAAADLTTFARTLLAEVDAAGWRAELALGDMATKDDVAIADIDATGTADATTFLRGDGAWTVPHISRTWTAPSRTVTTVYQNTAPHDMVLITHWSAAGVADVQISANGSTGWIVLDVNNSVSAPASATVMVPPGWYYRTTGTAVAIWREYV